MRLHHFTRPNRSFTRLCNMLISRKARRKAVCMALVWCLLILPFPGFGVQLPALAASTIEATTSSLQQVTLFFGSLFGPERARPRKETLAERTSYVAQLRITPLKLVAYEGQSLNFSALPMNSSGDTIQGVRLAWESSNANKASVDENGRVTFLQPGLVRITCRAGASESTARILVRPGNKPVQTDEQYHSDQNSFSGADSGSSTGSGASALSIPSILDKLVPTAYAQSNAYTRPNLSYDELWNDGGNLIGSPRNVAVESTMTGQVLPEGSNFEFAIPLVQLGGRGVDTGLSMFYNSRAWSRRGTSIAYDAITSWPSPGFSLGYGQIVTYDVQSVGAPLPAVTAKYLLIEPDGTRRYLGSGTVQSVGSTYTNLTLTTADGSHITYHGSIAGGTLYYPGGARAEIESVNNRLVPTRIMNTNGNYAQIAYKQYYCDSNGCYGAYPNEFPALSIDYITDSLGRVIQFNYDSGNNLISISKPAFGGTSQNPQTETLVNFYYEDKTFSNNFSGLTVERTSGSTRVLRRIFFPATATGYLFSHSDFGMVHTYSMRRQMTTTTDGVDSATVAFNYPTSGGTALTDAPAFTQRTETAVNAPTSTYSYSSSTDTVAQTKTFTITRPDSATVSLTRSTNTSSPANRLLVQSEVKDGTVSFAKTVKAYANDPSGAPQTQSVIGYDDAGNPAKTEYEYDQYGNVTNIREYGNQTGGAWQVRRRTRLTYKTDTAYVNAYLRGLVTLAETLDAKNNTSDSDDEVIAKTARLYDDYTVMGGMESYSGFSSPPGHDSGYGSSHTVRGNVTGTTQWTDVAGNTSITRYMKYDIFGNVVKAQVSCCQEKIYEFEEGHCWSRAEEVTSGDPNGTHLVDLYEYDFNTGSVTSQTDSADQLVQIFYDEAMRPTEIELSTGLVKTIQHDDASLSYSETTTSDAGTWTSSSTFDGWGRGLTSIGTNGSQVNMSYNAMGQVSGVTNPFTAGGQAGPSTSYQYDVLGRTTVTTLQDGSTVVNAYSGNFSAVTDPVGRVRLMEADGLGRLMIATEQASNGTLNQQTTYSYNLLDKLVEVNQGGQLRKYKYDSLGRLLFERIPEQQATINDGTGQMWTTKYTYTTFNSVATKQDARGVVTSYQYDTLHRLTDIDYNTSGATGVAATDSVDYDYNSDGLLDQVTIGQARYAEAYAYDDYARVSSITRTFPHVSSTPRSYVTSYQYNEASQVTQMTYPSGHLHSQGYDTKGRLASVGVYAGNMTYNSAGLIASLKTGPFVQQNQIITETYGYNDRLQITSQTATRNSTQLMNLSYNYQATAGDMGTGTQAGNSGQLVGVSGTIDGQTESAAYKYDLQGRLATSNQTTGGQIFQRRFDYDRWGNRTGAHDAVTGGTQIQSIALEQSSSVPTNRVQSVTQGSSTANYSYDAAGNVTNDGAHTYQYDAENRVVSVDGGTTATYEYDHQNRRIIKTASSARTDYVWEGSQVISEHNGSMNGWSTTVDYIRAGGRLIATLNYSVTQQCTTTNGVTTCTNSLSSTTTRYYLPDRLSTRLVLDSSGTVIGKQSHLPFGEEIAGSGQQEKHRFTSYERDSETGSDYAINRGYASSIGRFAQADPYRPSGHMVDPQSWNRYSYTKNDPINLIDPLGLDAFSLSPAIIAFFMQFVLPGESVNISGGGVSSESALGAGIDPGKGSMPVLDMHDSAAGIALWIMEQIEKIIDKVTESTKKLLEDNQACVDALTGAGGNPLALLNKLMETGNIKAGNPTYKDKDGKERQAIASWNGIQITLGSLFFGRYVGNIAHNQALHNLSTQQAQMLVLLHELGHGTKAEGNAHYTDGNIDHGKSMEFNEKIYQNCIANQKK